MKKSFFSMAALAMLMMGTMSACSQKSPYPGYEVSPTGLYYQFFTQNKEAAQPNVGDLVDMRIFCAVNDTTIIVANTENTLPMEAPLFAGDFYEGLAMMHKGDSASFIVNIDSTFIKWFHQPSLPAEFNSTDVLRFEVRVDDFYPESEYAARLGAKIKKDTDARIEKMKADHPEETATAAQQLTEYLAKNKIEAQPTASGLYYVMTQEGNGEKPEVGQMVQVHYTGKLLDGTLFDSSIERGQPISIPIGVGQVIPGWDEGILMMSKGEKGVLYIPYYLAYGDRQAGDKITPFSNLMFEVELIDFQ
jgi:FKBP-type peptidyl-prolyl cis-trans isomerase